MLRILLLAAAAVAILASCSARDEAMQPTKRSGLDPSRPTTIVTLPDGTTITAEVVLTPQEQAQGMMYRGYLGDDEGMLFSFEEIAPRGFWMFNTVIPLDIIWIGANKRIVEISEMTPPCASMDPNECPSYGGSVESGYVLELAAGRVAAHGLKVGDPLRFGTLEAHPRDRRP